MPVVTTVGIPGITINKSIRIEAPLIGRFYSVGTYMNSKVTS